MAQLSSTSEAIFIRKVIIVALIGAFAMTLWLLSPILLLAFAAVLIAMAFRTLARPLMRLGLGEKPAIIVTTLGVLALIVGAVVFFGAELVNQWHALDQRIGEIATQTSDRLDLPSLASLFASGDKAAGLASWLPRFLAWGVTLGQALVGAAVVLVAGLYIALDPMTYRNGILKLVPPRYRANAVATLDDIGEALQRWLGGVGLTMLIVGVLTGLGLWLAGVQSPLALGLLAGLSTAVPYIGSIFAAIVTVAVAAGQSFDVVIGAVIVMFIVQQIESNVVTPLVVGGAVSIAPAAGLLAIVAMSVLFGPLGVLLGFPLAIVVDIAVRRLYVRDALDEPVEILGQDAQRSQDVCGSAGP